MKKFTLLIMVMLTAACGGGGGGGGSSGDSGGGSGNSGGGGSGNTGGGTPEPANYRILNLNTGTVTSTTSLPDTSAESFYTTNMVFRRIPVGSFTKGAGASSLGAQNDESLTLISMTSEYWIAVVEFTQGQWITITKDAVNVPWRQIGPASVVGLTQTDNQRPAFGVLRSELSSVLTAWNNLFSTSDLRIPTDNQWEYACRAGTSTAFSWGNSIDPAIADKYAACYDTSGGVTGPSKVKMNRQPNAWDMWDMHGNIREWAGEGATFVLRGGSWSDNMLQARSANKFPGDPLFRHALSGARLVLVTP